jgi:hypothetical protein
VSEKKFRLKVERVNMGPPARMSLRSSRSKDNGDQLSKAFGETPPAEPAEPIAPPKEITEPRQTFAQVRESSPIQRREFG